MITPLHIITNNAYIYYIDVHIIYIQRNDALAPLESVADTKLVKNTR